MVRGKATPMNLLHRLNLLCHFVGWRDNPFARRIEAGLWADLACRVPRFMQGLDPDVDYPELKGRL